MLAIAGRDRSGRTLHPSQVAPNRPTALGRTERREALVYAT